jgi:tricorn protease
MGVHGYLRFPTIFDDTVIFTAEDDLWRVGVEGGRAERLTAGVAEFTHAHFSPDGQLVAFKGRTEGPTEIYVMPADGGEVQRLTYHGVDSTPAGWRPDGSAIVYASAGGQPSRRMVVLHQIAPSGGEPVTLPYGPARSIAFGPNGALVLGRNTTEPAFWKRYRGGTAGYLYIDPTGGGEFRKLVDLKGNITAPCWVGDRVYFISDHEGIGVVYSCLASGSDLRRHTQPGEYYARGLSTDGKRLVYFAGGGLFVLDPNADEAQHIEITLPTARTQRARQFVPAGRHLDGWAPHPQGHSLAITTRGKAFSQGAWEGPVVQQGEVDGVRYRLAAWLADGKRLVTLSDPGPEPRLAVFASDGSTQPRIFEDFDIGHVLEMRAAPVGEQVALVNHRNEVLLADVARGTLRTLDRSDFGRNELAGVTSGIAWSPDGHWLAYALGINPRQTAIKLCRVESGETWQITEPVLHDMRPAFDPAGRFLYFLSKRVFDPVLDNLQFDWSFPKGMRPYLLTLRADQRSPFVRQPEAPKSEAERQLEEGKKDERAIAPPEVRIDLDGIAARIVAFPVPEGRYGRVQGTHEGVIFTSMPVEGTLEEQWPAVVPEAKASLEGYHFESYKQERLVDGVSDFEVTADGKAVLIRAGDRLRLLKAGEKPQGEGEAQGKPGRESGWIDLDRVKVSIRPEAEWQQMFAETWRLQREQFWVPDMGGVNWQAAYQRYAALVDCIGSRSELSDLIWELQGELGSSHAYEIGGEYRPRPEYRQGHLGVDWRFDPASSRYTITRLVKGDPWDREATSPLLEPGIGAQAGDAVLAINGQAVTGQRSPQQLLVNQAGQEVQVLLQPAAGGEPRSVTVRALSDDHAGRYRDWVETNRRKVHEETNGKVGYIHVPDMGSGGYAEFHRYFLAEYDYDALIVDVRWNGGGIVSPLVLEKLMRPRLGYSFQRWGPTEPYMIQAPKGNIVALTDENAGSDGDIFSHAFKMMKLGPLVGKRTWGGVIGIEPYLWLADGTVVTQPEFSFWFKDVGWGVENYGTDPDIEVDFPPQAHVAGTDPQLDRSIAEAKRLLEEHPFEAPKPAQHPDRGYPPRG